MQKHVCLHAIVSGKVQGVGFRAFTHAHATQMALTGWVKNLHDGTVEVEVSGPQHLVEDFLAVLHRGPQYARVDHVKVDWKETNRHTEGFQVIL